MGAFQKHLLCICQFRIKSEDAWTKSAATRVLNQVVILWRGNISAQRLVNEARWLQLLDFWGFRDPLLYCMLETVLIGLYVITLVGISWKWINNGLLWLINIDFTCTMKSLTPKEKQCGKWMPFSTLTFNDDGYFQPLCEEILLLYRWSGWRVKSLNTFECL